ncbi:MAG: RelA/SpoT family protein, partial [bacterium]
MNLVTFDDVKQAIRERKLAVDLDILQLAYELAKEAHEGQLRSTGEPYIHHPLATAKTLAEWRLDQPTIIAGILHDVPEDTNVSLEEIHRLFGAEVAKLVQGVTKLGRLKYRGLERYSENLRKMFVAMADDVRTVFIKFADRLHNLSTLQALPMVKQQRIATETLEIYAAIADRLGMGEIKDQLEDLAFKALRPEEYQQMEQLLAEQAPKLEQKLLAFQLSLKSLLKENNVSFLELYGRHKHNYSVWKKLTVKGKQLTQIHDLIALRVIVPSVEDCYQTLAVVHRQWTPVPGRAKDYIARPKDNGYQSLHTAVFDNDGTVVEIQIRTSEMHEQAEYGIAAHWHYKEKGAKRADNKHTAWLQEIAELQKRLTDDDLLTAAKLELFKNRIFALTPHGDVIDLPDGATIIDFAYHVHTDIG